MDWMPISEQAQRSIQDGHHLPILNFWNHLKGVSEIGWQNWTVPAAVFGVVRNENGEIRWRGIVDSVIAGILLAGGTALVVQSNRVERLEAVVEERRDFREDVSRIQAIQETVIDRLNKLEQGQNPATARRFTRDDAVDMEARLTRRLERLETRRGM